MGFTTKLQLINQKFEQPINGSLDLSGSTYLNRAEYLTGMTLTYNSKSITDVDFVTGQTANLQADIDYVSGKTNALETWSGTTETRVDNLETWSGTTETRVDNLETWSGTTETRIDTIEGQYITGGTSGLLSDGSHDLKLGGAITENTILSGSYVFGINANRINLTGTTGINLGSCIFALNLVGGNNLVCINSITGQLGTTSISSIGGVTGGTNGICSFPNQRLGLGGTLTQNSSILGAGFDLTLGTDGSKLDVLEVNTSGNIDVASDVNLALSVSGGTITTGDLKGLRYTADYSSSFVDASLVTKCYVDTIATGLQPHDVVRVATTANIDLNGAETIDGVVVVNGDRVLVKNQTVESENGIYVVDTAGAWTRAEDFNFTPYGEIVNGDLVPVFTGDTQANTIWVLTSPDPIYSGDSLVFTIFSRLLGVVAGDGIDITPIGANQTVSVNLMTNGGLAICSTELAINENIAGTGLTWNTGVLHVNAASGGVSGISVRYDGSENLVVNAADINTALGGVLTGATNGLHVVGQTVVLGGDLIEDTSINIDSGNLFITGGTGFGLAVTPTNICLGNYNGNAYFYIADADEEDNYYVDIYAQDESGNNWGAVYIDARHNSAGINTGDINADASIVVKPVAIFVNGLSGYFSGITYVHDYSDNYTSLSLITYGDLTGATSTMLTGATNGLTKVGQDVTLGGTLTGDVIIGLGTTNSFEFFGDENIDVFFNEPEDEIHFYTTATGINMYGSIVRITGVVALESTPATGEATDVVLVWNSTDKQIKQIPATSLGEDNNNYSKVIVTASTGLTATSPYVILINHTAPITITLPVTPFDGQAFKIKDASGDALSNNITIDSGSGETIDGSQMALINTDYGALELVYDSTLDGWFSLAFVN